MRQIKFRAKYIGDGKTWIFGDLIHKRLDKNCVIIQEDNGLGSDCVIDTVGQFTGSYSTDGSEIYEGDIVEEEESKKRYAIVFDDGAFRLATSAQKEYLDKGIHPFLEDYLELPVLADALLEAPYYIVGNIFNQ